MSSTDEVEREIERRLWGRKTDDREDPQVVLSARNEVERVTRRPEKKRRRKTEELEASEGQNSVSHNGGSREVGEYLTATRKKIGKVEQRKAVAEVKGPLIVVAKEDMFLPRKRATKHQNGGQGGLPEGEEKTEEGLVKEFRGEVEDLGASQFTGKDRKEWQRKKLAALGARAPKQMKIPLTILKGMRKAEKKREIVKREKLRDSHMLPTSNRKRKHGK